MNNDLKRVAVYGSLRKGMYNHVLINNAKFVEKYTETLPFRMIGLGAFPALVSSNENHKVVIETYDLNPEEYRNVEYLEGYPDFYDKYQFKDKNGVDTEVYVLNDRNSRSDDDLKEHIEDWVEYTRNDGE